jgi:hypothetical protein
MKKNLVIVVLMLLFMISAGVASAESQKPDDAILKNAGMGSTQGTAILSGKVVETMDSAGYTYVNLEKEGKNTWVAVPQMKVTVGEEMSFAPGMVMKNFTSKTLGRTFDALVFSGGPVDKKSEGSPHKSVGKKGAEPAQAANIKVDKASGPDAYTVAELYEKRNELDSKNITVRGQVVKVSPSIMGKNWIHIQDGTGTPSTGTNDLLLTSQELPSVGDVVTVKGTLARDKDFGMGYKYAVIVEETSIKK